MTTVLPTRAPGATQPPPPAPAAGRTRGALRRLAAFLGGWAVRTLVALAVLTLAGLGLGPHLFGYRTMTMLSGSMAPTINAGDVVVTTPLDVHDVTEGMLITYHIPIDDHRVVTHRVVDVEHTPDGRVAVRTRGDANDDVDPWTAVLTGDTAWEVQAVVPRAGHLIAALRTPALRVALLYGAPALLAGWMLLTIWRPAPDEEDPRSGATEATPC